ncbi:sulfurtransferase TusD [Pseudohongiella nitratireducens]|jgi:tRNA 2-thiouridine synthesizing protein D|uniref:Sulfurtransferase TusD n=1 Tax=Pseudohongiella nitratireducens TaxID=1768907 RepID=A0A917LQM1_9GAMM|nr:sulfurtransferase complex subunit TusD [Pseudohongiella nitratireducens]GGG49544.1 sulfurtransferase TusD [Pseudohongiella nitratireducens]
MKFSLVVFAAPDGDPATLTALKFAQAVLDQGHEIYRLFFYQRGVYHGSSLAVYPQDETDINQAWQSFIAEQQLDAVVCIASAVKRGILNAEEANRYERPSANLADNFTLSGLGQWVDACVHSDRVVSFGEAQ